MFMRTKEDLINEIKKYNPDLSFDEEDKKIEIELVGI